MCKEEFAVKLKSGQSGAGSVSASSGPILDTEVKPCQIPEVNASSDRRLPYCLAITEYSRPAALDNSPLALLCCSSACQADDRHSCSLSFSFTWALE